VNAGVGAADGDVVVAMLSPFGYFPGFIVSAFLTGYIYEYRSKFFVSG
jgi:biotin transporter BioY